MDREAALSLLRSGSSHERLQAVRSLAKLGLLSDLSELRAILRTEGVSFVKRAIGHTIQKIEAGIAVPAESSKDDEPVESGGERRAYLRAVSWVTESLLHEIHPKVGAIRMEARKALAEYDASNLKRRIDALDSVLSGIEELRKASTSPTFSEFDVSQLIKQIITDEPKANLVQIYIQGQQPTVVFGDPNLLMIAICNALRNSIEATLSLSTNRKPVIVSWGETDVDYWINILDSGPGIVGATEAAFEIGRTTKTGHRGFGLAIARQAMITIDGQIGLQPAVGGGARAEIRWFK